MTESIRSAKSTGKRAAKEAAARPGPRADKADGESAVLAKIAAMPGPDRALGERLHAIIKASAPALSPRLWYGMPAYAKNGKVVCFFQSAQKFKTRYATFGFMQEANLDEGAMWPTAFALKELTPAEEVRIAALVKKRFFRQSGGQRTNANRAAVQRGILRLHAHDAGRLIGEVARVDRTGPMQLDAGKVIARAVRGGAEGGAVGDAQVRLVQQWIEIADVFGQIGIAEGGTHRVAH